MSENYKLTREVALKIVELRKDGISFLAISKKINSEFGLDIDRSSIGKFYKNFLDGKSRILPQAEMEKDSKISIHVSAITDKAKIEAPVNQVNQEKNDIDSGLIALINDAGLSDGSDYNIARQPSNDLLGVFQTKPRKK